MLNEIDEELNMLNEEIVKQYCCRQKFNQAFLCKRYSHLFSLPGVQNKHFVNK